MRCHVAALAALLATWPGLAGAQQASDLARAKESFNAGAAAYASGEYLAAIQALDSAYALTPLPAIGFSLAQAERRQYFVDHDRAHLDRAVALYRKYLEQVPSGGRRSDAVEALSQLEPMAVKSVSPDVAAAPPAESTRRTRLIVTCDAPGALVSVDGHATAVSPWIGEVDPGPHVVKVSAEGFFESEREIVAVAGELIPSAVSLRERPSTVAVWASPDAGLYVDGTFVRQGGEGVVLTMPSGAHRVDVAQKGHVVSSHDVELQRGENRDLRVFLVPTSQRRASHGLFIAGGAALGAGVLLGGLALHAQSSAQDFLDQTARRNVSNDELSSYREDVAARNRYRTGAAICLASSVGFFFTALLLRELDQPALEEAKRPAVAVSPLLVRGGGGAVVSF